jgi:hypothetical protein
MRIHLKNVSPKVHGMITEHKASHDHENLDQTVSCLIEEAMKRFDETDKIEDLNALLKRYMLKNDELNKEIRDLKKSLDDTWKIKRERDIISV